MDNTKLCPFLNKNGTCVAGGDGKSDPQDCKDRFLEIKMQYYVCPQREMVFFSQGESNNDIVDRLKQYLNEKEAWYNEHNIHDLLQAQIDNLPLSDAELKIVNYYYELQRRTVELKGWCDPQLCFDNNNFRRLLYKILTTEELLM